MVDEQLGDNCDVLGEEQLEDSAFIVDWLGDLLTNLSQPSNFNLISLWNIRVKAEFSVMQWLSTPSFLISLRVVHFHELI